MRSPVTIRVHVLPLLLWASSREEHTSPFLLNKADRGLQLLTAVGIPTPSDIREEHVFEAQEVVVRPQRKIAIECLYIYYLVCF